MAKWGHDCGTTHANPAVVQVERYGALVWEHTAMDARRKTDCLCLDCASITRCDNAAELYQMCKDFSMAMAVTRCQAWQRKE